MEATTKPSSDQVEQEIGALLDQERFEPPAGFRDKALISDESVHEEAARDPEAWWAKQAEALDWFEPWDEVLDESGAPFYKWFAGGKLNASYNALDRHVDAGRGDRVAYHWRGRRARSATSPTPSCWTRSSASPTCSRSAVWSPATWSGSTYR